MTQIQAEYFDVPLSARSITSVQQNNHGVISATKAKQYTITNLQSKCLFNGKKFFRWTTCLNGYQQ